MGIDGLLPLLKPLVKTRHISDLSNRKAAIDAMSWLYRGCYSCALEIYTKRDTTAYLTFAYKMITLLQRFNITPVLVFDGRDLHAKEKTNEFRKSTKHAVKEKAFKLLNEGNEEEARKMFTKCLKIKRQMIYNLIDMLKAIQISYLVAPYEADAQIAYLCINRYVDFAITEDSDLLCYNCPETVFKLGVQGECQYLNLSEYREKRMKKEKLGNDSLNVLFSLKPEDFTYICIMAGCDYLPSIKGMGIKKALSYFDRFGRFESVARRLRVDPPFRDKVPERYEEIVNNIGKIFMYQLVYDPIKCKITPLNVKEGEDPEKVIEDYEYFIGSKIENIEEFVKGDVNVKTLERREVKQIDVKEILGEKTKMYKNYTQSQGMSQSQMQANQDMIAVQRAQQEVNKGYKRYSKSYSGLKTESQELVKEFMEKCGQHQVEGEERILEYWQGEMEEEESVNEVEGKQAIEEVKEEDNRNPGIPGSNIDFLFLLCEEFSKEFGKAKTGGNHENIVSKKEREIGQGASGGHEGEMNELVGMRSRDHEEQKGLHSGVGGGGSGNNQIVPKILRHNPFATKVTKGAEESEVIDSFAKLRSIRLEDGGKRSSIDKGATSRRESMQDAGGQGKKESMRGTRHSEKKGDGCKLEEEGKATVSCKGNSLSSQRNSMTDKGNATTTDKESRENDIRNETPVDKANKKETMRNLISEKEGKTVDKSSKMVDKGSKIIDKENILPNTSSSILINQKNQNGNFIVGDGLCQEKEQNNHYGNEKSPESFEENRKRKTPEEDLSPIARTKSVIIVEHEISDSKSQEKIGEKLGTNGKNEGKPTTLKKTKLSHSKEDEKSQMKISFFFKSPTKT